VYFLFFLKIGCVRMAALLAFRNEISSSATSGQTSQQLLDAVADRAVDTRTRYSPLPPLLAICSPENGRSPDNWHLSASIFVWFVKNLRRAASIQLGVISDVVTQLHWGHGRSHLILKGDCLVDWLTVALAILSVMRFQVWYTAR